MLDYSQWEEVLSKITGQVVKGTERVSTAEIMDLLLVANDLQLRREVAKRVPSFMRRLSWSGPRHINFRRDGGKRVILAGYWRPISRPPQPHPDMAGEMAADVNPTGLSDNLPHALEQVTRRSLRKLDQILRVPLDPADGNLIRAQVTAALGAINAQLRADEQRLRTRTTGDVLERLERLIAEQKKLLPKQHLAVSPPTVQPDVELASSNAEGVPLEASGEG